MINTYLIIAVSAVSVILIQTVIIVFLIIKKNKIKNEKNSEIKILESELNYLKKSEEEKQELLNQNRKTLKNEFQILASEILDAKQKNLTYQSSRDLKSLLEPFREQVKNFEKKIEENYISQTKDNVSLKEQLQFLKEQNFKISKEAENLTSALKGSYKTQGSWGEMLLESVLEKSGLTKGREYTREESFNEENKRKRPDVILYLPDNRHLIIDSKVSLNSYIKYTEAENENNRKIHLKNHIIALKNHIESLAEKKYQDISNLNSPDMIIMFVPVEHAYFEAFKNNSDILEYAFDRKIAVATPSTLLGVLKVVSGLWKLEIQNNSAKQLSEHAKKVYDKLSVFVNYIDDIGKQITKLNETYEKSVNNLYKGKGNLISLAEEFKDFGIYSDRKK